MDVYIMVNHKWISYYSYYLLIQWNNKHKIRKRGGFVYNQFDVYQL
jgi:hypothetical protein